MRGTLSHSHPAPQSHPRPEKRLIDCQVIDRFKHRAKESSVLDC